MFTINFELYQGYYFYSPTTAQETDIFTEREEAKETVQIPDKKAASWYIAAPSFVRTNIYRLIDHPRLKELLEKRAKLIQTFRATNSDEAKEAVENFMKTIIGVLREILKTCHNLYWLDAATKKRSQFSFEECLEKAVDFGYEKLKIMNIITDITQPASILSTIIDKDYNDKIRQTKKSMGYKESSTMDKKSNKKK